MRYFITGLISGGTVTGAVTGAFGGLLSPLDSHLRTAVFLAVATTLALRDFDVFPFPLPQNARLIPREIEHRGPFVSSFQFGFEMGTGVRSFVSSSSPYLLVAALILLGDPLIGLLSGVSFGIGRAAMPIFRSGAGEAHWDQQLDATLPPLVRFSAILCFVCFGVQIFGIR